jgi:hypothetical protein
LQNQDTRQLKEAAIPVYYKTFTAFCRFLFKGKDKGKDNRDSRLRGNDTEGLGFDAPLVSLPSCKTKIQGNSRKPQSLFIIRRSPLSAVFFSKAKWIPSCDGMTPGFVQW